MGRFRLHCAVLAAGLLLGAFGPRFCAAQVIQDPSFEMTPFIGRDYYPYSPFWFYSSVYVHGQVVGEPNPVGDGYTPYGQQFIALWGDIPGQLQGHGYAEQQVGGFVAGRSYRLSFAISSYSVWSSWIWVTVSGAHHTGSETFPAPWPAASGQNGTHYFNVWQRYTYDFVPTQSVLTFHFQHMDPPAFFGFSGVGLDSVHVEEVCVKPPGGMVAWWPLDETAGRFAKDIVGGKTCVQVPSFPPAGFTSPGSNSSSGAYNFIGTNYVTGTSVTGNFGGNFTVDAWVSLNNGRTCNGAVVDKEIGNPTAAMTGYQLFVNSSNTPGCVLGIGNAPLLLFGTPLTTGVGVWHHLAMTALRIYPTSTRPPTCQQTTYIVKLFVDGVETNSGVISNCGNRSVAGGGTFRIGQHSGNSTKCEFGGRIDEVELFDRALGDAEIASLVTAGKCKCRAQVCEVVQFAQLDNIRKTTIHLCNDGPDGFVPYTITGLPAGTGCEVDGSHLTFAPASGGSPVPQLTGTVFIPHLKCADVDVNIQLTPPGILTNANTGACYEVSAGNCGQAGTARGRTIGPTVINTVGNCTAQANQCSWLVDPRRPWDGSWVITNTGTSSSTITYRFQESPATAADTTYSLLSLDGLAVGQATAPVVLNLPPGGSQQVNVSAQLTGAQPLDPTRLQLLMGTVAESLGVADEASLYSDETCGEAYMGWCFTDSGTAAPAPRSEATLVYDPVGKRLILFGGLSAGLYRSDVWAMALGDSMPRWSQLSLVGGPGPRASHSAVYDPIGQRMLVFGGSTGLAYTNDVWALSLGGGPEAWSAISTTGSVPAARRSHSAIFDPVGNRMLVFGGTPYTNDVSSLTLAGTPTWHALTTTGPPPTGREGHSAVYDAAGQRMIVFGGDDVSDYRNDLWALSLGSSPAWSQISPGGTLPPGRRYQVAALDSASSCLSIFGGSNGTTRFNDVWSIPLAAPTSWLNTTPLSGPAPNPLQNSAASQASVGDFIYVFGGLDSASTNNDLWAFPSDRSCANTEFLAGVAPRPTSPITSAFMAPNPFSATTAVSFTLAAKAPVTIRIYDVAGRLVRQLVEGPQGPGPVRVRWDGLSSEGRRVSPGIYLVRVRAGAAEIVQGRAVRLY